MLICEDLWDDSYPLKPCALYREKGARYLFCINASPFVGSNPGSRDGKRFVRNSVVRHQIRRHGLPPGLRQYGRSRRQRKEHHSLRWFSAWPYDRLGRLVAALPQFEESQEEVVFEDGVSEPVSEPPFNREDEIYRALVMSVRDLL